MIPSWQKGIVTKIEEATHNTKRYWIKLPETASFHFKPGQFVTLDLPIHEQKNKRWRSYSIASVPNGTNEFELIIVLVEDGQGSPYIFQELMVGSSVTLRGPQGMFTLPDILDKDLFFICTGTGIAPFRSMVNHIHRQQIDHENIYLIYGCRTQDDLLYFDELRDLEKSLSKFHFIPTLSREKWDGNSGYVHRVYDALLKERQPAHFMLCGWRAMIDEAKQNLLELGYDKKDIHLELYG